MKRAFYLTILFISSNFPLLCGQSNELFRTTELAEVFIESLSRNQFQIFKDHLSKGNTNFAPFYFKKNKNDNDSTLITENIINQHFKKLETSFRAISSELFIDDYIVHDFSYVAVSGTDDNSFFDNIDLYIILFTSSDKHNQTKKYILRLENIFLINNNMLIEQIKKYDGNYQIL